MTNWEPHAILANCSFSEAIDAESAAFVPPEDPRIQAINAEHPIHADFLDRFSDAFGKKVRPTVLLLKTSATNSYRTVNAIASIRDVLSSCVMPVARARHIRAGQGLSACFSTAFEFYPWMIGKDYEDLIMYTPSVHGCHDVSDFSGQRSPEVHSVELSKRDLDGLLWPALVERWCRAYAVEPSSDQSLMRSLNMAYHAGQLPSNQDTRHFDYGRQIALWVSAFEILAHPGSGAVDRWTVCRLLDSAYWTNEENKKKDIPLNKKPGTYVTLPSSLYLRLHSVRNGYLHGNPVDSQTLQIPSLRRTLADFAAPLYRMALTAFLGLRPRDPASAATPHKLREAFVDGCAWGDHSDDFEESIAQLRGLLSA